MIELARVKKECKSKIDLITYQNQYDKHDSDCANDETMRSKSDLHEYNNKNYMDDSSIKNKNKDSNFKNEEQKGNITFKKYTYNRQNRKND